MYKKILTAVNEHLNSEAAAKYAMRLALAVSAKLYICFVAEKGRPASVIDRAGEAMKRVLDEAVGIGVNAEAVAETGEPVKNITGIVRREGIDIVFASTRKDDIRRRFYAGTVARRLLLGLPCSVALVRVVRMGRVHPEKILVPLKARSDRADERAYFISKVAQAFDSKVFVFHAHKPVSKFFHGELHLSPAQWEERLPMDVSRFMGLLEKYGVPLFRAASHGRTGRVIAVEAFTKRHDLIVMGASERSLLSSLIRGNPVEELLRETPCNLIILKPRMAEPSQMA